MPGPILHCTIIDMGDLKTLDNANLKYTKGSDAALHETLEAVGLQIGKTEDVAKAHFDAVALGTTGLFLPSEPRAVYDKDHRTIIAREVDYTGARGKDLRPIGVFTFTLKLQSLDIIKVTKKK